MSARLALAAALVLAAPALAQQAPAAAAQRQRAQRDSARADSLAPRIEYRREVYNYGGGSRDPFQTLVASQVGPEIGDLRVVSIVYDARGGNNLAIVRQANNPAIYRLRRGDVLGRMRVIQVRQYEVVFQIDELGFERQEVLSITRPEVNR